MERKQTLACSYTCTHVDTDLYFSLPEYAWLLSLVAIAIIIYFAHDYPQWKAERAHHQAKKAATNPSTLDTPSTTAQEPVSPQQQQQQQQESMISARWIPYLPLAVILVAIKAVWEGFRHLVLRSILAAEESIPYVKSSSKDAVHWAIHHGPTFFRTKIFQPAHTLSMALWDSMATTIEATLLPGLHRFCTLTYAYLKDPVYSTFKWAVIAANYCLGVAQWLAVECLFVPASAIWKRFSVLGLALTQAAKTTLHGLAKDARELAFLLFRTGTWAWGFSKIHLRTLGGKLHEVTQVGTKHLKEVVLPWCLPKILKLEDLTLKFLAEFVPRVIQGVYKFGGWTVEVLPQLAQKTSQSVRKAVVDGIQFVRSHPTFKEAIHELSIKAKEGGRVALEKLESENWLLLLEQCLESGAVWAIQNAYLLVLVVIDIIAPYYQLAAFLVDVATVTYHHAKDPTEVIMFVRERTAIVKQSVGRSYRAFISTAYDDFKVAIDFAKPIVSRVVNVFVWIIRHLWQVITWISTTIHKSVSPAMAWAHLNIGVPVKNVWDTKVMPGWYHAQAFVREKTPVITAAAWNAMFKLTKAMQGLLVVLTQMMAKVMAALGILGSHLNERWEVMKPQLEEFKKQTGEAMDQVVLVLNDKIVEWTKNEKSTQSQ
ncbi:MAG: hypothetical protein J3Q66DRAFT_348635 [Benniella sp.]|nr:MAG: hypothetical protein J3Q66DRAFT_348635 [Benniella sp.]